MGVYNLAGQVRQTHLKSEITIQEMLQGSCQMDGVDDANVNAAKGSLAITYENTVTNPEKLLEGIRAEGIEVKRE